MLNLKHIDTDNVESILKRLAALEEQRRERFAAALLITMAKREACRPKYRG